MTMPRLHALRAAWSQVAPAPLTLHRLAQWVGLPPVRLSAPGQGSAAAHAGSAASRRPTEAAALVQAFAAQGLPVFSQRPADPMLDAAGF